VKLIANEESDVAVTSRAEQRSSGISLALMRWFLAAAAAMVVYQTMVPPVVGLANQSDFRRVIGKFGYGPEEPVIVSAIAMKYVPDANYRVPSWEQFSSEEFFVRAALGVNRVISKDGKFDIRVMGFVHEVAFLAALTWLLRATRRWVVVWPAIVLIATDAGYVAYLNSFYTEPASLIFVLLLIAESIAICSNGLTTAGLTRCIAWSVLLILAKPINAPLGVLLGLFALRLSPRSWLARAGAAAIAWASVFMIATAPREIKAASAYNLVFLSVLPESRTPAADAASLGLPAGSEDYSRIGAWAPRSRLDELKARGVIGGKVTVWTVLRFYLSRPTRMWRHIAENLRVATLVRPDLGNFAPSAGYPPGAQSKAFSLWSDFHRVVLVRLSRSVFFALMAAVIVLCWRRRRSLAQDFTLLLLSCCLLSFLTASFGDAWDTVRHMFLFNVLLDASVITGVMAGGRGIVRVFGLRHASGDARTSWNRLPTGAPVVNQR
jgi:hypothetical protein